MQIITSSQNAVLKCCRSLKNGKGREAAGLYLLEGSKPVREALLGHAPVHALLAAQSFPDAELLLQAENAGIPVYQMQDSLLASAADAQTPQGIVAMLPLPEYQTLSGQRLVALDGVQDPGNCGTIWRTADAAGFGGILFGQGCADPYAPKTVRATMGSVLRLPAFAPESLESTLQSYRQQGYAILVSSLQGEPFFQISRWPDRLILVIGSEARGVSAAVAAQATHLLKLPMLGGAESLNAAVAAGIMLYSIAEKSIQ